MESFNQEVEVYVRKEEIKNRIESAPFHSEKDREIAALILDQLTERFKQNKVGKEAYLEALTAVDFITPRINERKFRVIADITINPIMERTVASRLNSKEHDIMSPEGSWGLLPEMVREKIAMTNLALEMTGSCTVKCSFCDLAEKGPIEDKVSLESLRSILEYFKDKLIKTPGIVYSDNLYWGTDPFDAKWKTDTGDKDYLDVAEMYWETMKGEPRALYTSTALPLGEEFRVLNFAGQLISKMESKSIGDFNKLRVSLTNANSKRAEAIRQIMTTLHDDPSKDEVFVITDNRNLNEARTGSRWNTPGHLSNWDIIGPNCRDAVILGLKSTDVVLMEGSSSDRPKGESRFPVAEIDTAKRAVKYTIPSYYQKPDDISVKPFENYPDISYSEVTFDRESGRKLGEEKITVRNNPHRAFLKLVAADSGLAIKYKGDVPDTEREKYKREMSHEIEVVDSYLRLGTDNWAMRKVMDYLKKSYKIA